MTQLKVRQTGTGWIVEDTQRPPERPIRVAQRDIRPFPRPRVSTTALLIGYMIALGIVAGLAALLGNYAR